MIIPLILAFQSVSIAPVTIAVDSARDSTKDVHIDDDSARFAQWRERRRIALTPALLASAYRDPRARDAIARARRAQDEQDSSLLAYDATARQRVTVGLGFRAAGKERLLMRTENASRVRWQRGRGAVVDVLGARTVFPMLFHGVRVPEEMLDMDAIPYYPGREGLLRLAGVQRATKRDEGLFIHPLEPGAEAYYRYATGDSITFALPDGRRVRLREVDVAAREPRFDLIVGSLWFDIGSGQLVRAAFRPSMPFDIVRFVEAMDPDAFKDVPGWVKPAIFPMELTVAAFTVEYGLHEQRWWLPRLETVEGRARAGFTRAPFSVEQRFEYASVNGTDSLPTIFASREDSLAQVPNDSLWGARREARRDSMRAAHEARRERRRRGEHVDEDDDLASIRCPKGDTITRREMRYGGTLPVLVRVPCDTVALARSPELPPSIFDSGDELFGRADRDQLVKELGLTLQPEWHPLPPTIHYGLERGLTRYNRVEGLSMGVLVERTYGKGYTADARARVGIADWQPNAEAHLRRGDGRRTYALGVYRRLSAANDWGDPLSFGSSLSAFLWGHDEGFYYRDWGAELTSNHVGESATFGWRLFAEQQGAAGVHTNVSLPNALNGRDFIPNIHAQRAKAFGLAANVHRDVGLDPHGWRATLDLRGEGATGTFDYARAAVDATVSHGLGPHLDGALTGSAGSSVGTMPVQRWWYLGGVQTVRGQEAGTRAGDAYWLGRAELGSSFVAVRPTLFFDIGWAGARGDWDRPGRPISGAGLGLSFLDGLIRLDAARGIHPDHGVRVDLYTEARF